MRESGNRREPEAGAETAVTGEVVLEFYPEGTNKIFLNSMVREVIRRFLREDAPGLEWASYLVLVSAGRDTGEIRCQVDIATSGEIAAFAIGYGASPARAFQDAMGRMQWCDNSRLVFG